MTNVLRELFFPRKLLGLNSRNLNYILRFDCQKAIKVAKNKLRTKTVLATNNLPVAKTYFKIKSLEDLRKFDFTKLPDSFVLKPNLGYGGKGIIIIYSKSKKTGKYIASGNIKYTNDDLKFNIFKILEGAYSENKKDVAFFEERVKLASEFKPFTYKGGVPDVRVITYNSIPVMAMLRVPTIYSQGKANLELGAIGLGIDMRTGYTTYGTFFNKKLEYFHDTRILVKNIKTPYFTKILTLASEVSRIIGLNFCGVDIAIDRESGPIILELNAWPGLKIQLANQDFLKERLLRIEDIKKVNIERAVNISKELFGTLEPRETDEYGNKKVINTFEEIEIVLPSGKKTKILAKIDTGAWRSSLDESIVKELGLEVKKDESIKVYSSLGEEFREVIDISFKLKGELITSKATITTRSHLKYQMIIGRRDIKGFLVKI